MSSGAPGGDEPMVLAAWIDMGQSAERTGALSRAATHYCAAARFGSLEAQYRLGGLLVRQGDDPARAAAAGMALLRLAAQGGHAGAAALLAQWPTPVTGPGGVDDLPACLAGGDPPLLADAMPAPPVAQPIAHEVVEDFVAALPTHKRRHARLIQRLAPGFAVDGRLALAVARAESNFEADAVSARNAQGLMQLIPETAERFGVRNPFDPEQNVRAGLSYLRWLLDRFGGDVALVSAAYNAGEGVVERYGGVPPYPETRAYVQRVLRWYGAPRHAEP